MCPGLPELEQIGHGRQQLDGRGFIPVPTGSQGPPYFLHNKKCKNFLSLIIPDRRG
jgi:hypothetical protein